MAASSEKKSFLKGLPPNIKYSKFTSYRIPAEIFRRIVNFHTAEKSTNCCKDIRDFITQLALEGLKQVQLGNENLMSCAVYHGVKCNTQVDIDYSIIGYNELADFSIYVNGSHIKNVQQAVSYSIISGYNLMVGKINCPQSRKSQPIYS